MTTVKDNTPDLSSALLEEQINKFTDFDRELVAGAGAKTIMADLKAKSRDLWQLKPHDIVVIDGFNPRTQNTAYFEGVEALAENMVAHGYMQDKPLSVYIAKIDGQDTVALNDGHRRLAAVKRAIELGAKIETIPVVVKDRSHNMVDLTISLLHSNEGQPFTVYEKAVIAKRLKGYGWDNAKIAAEMRCTPAFVGQLLGLAGAPEAIQELVRNGKMSATHAMDVVKEHGEGAVEVATAAVKGKKKTTAKDTTDPKIRKAKALGYELFQVAERIFKNSKVVEAMPTTVYTELDRLMTEVEQAAVKAAERAEKAKAAKVAKPPKAPKPIKVKKTTPLAKKVAKASAKTPKVKAQKLAPWDQQAAKPQARGGR